MRLSDYTDILDIEIIRDGEFDTLGNCTDTIDVPYLSFLGKAKFIDKINRSISCIITTADIASQITDTISGLAIAKEPKIEYAKLHNYLSTDERYVGKTFKTIIGANCNISPMALVAENNVIIGDNVTIGPFSVIKERTEIGNNVIIRENCVIGGKTYNYAIPEDGTIIELEDCGKVIIEDDAEICALCHIDNCPLPTEVTRIGKECKIGAKVQVAHGSILGCRVMIPGGTTISGNCNIGNNVFLGPESVISNRIRIGEGAHVSIGAVVTRDVSAHETVSGNFAINHDTFIDNLKKMR
ncbi:MAG: UDP-3-O-(3-hydroxymyristoyl)glucosamine N-acyltransferase [Pseudobutyrivibrio sp.]|nr:UDP-3-O-(3-hydroxymyristoyl)glucosamine N-acyltransferase [Pseudobutyrivibrio sp.]